MDRANVTIFGQLALVNRSIAGRAQLFLAD